MSVFDDLVGQVAVRTQLERAAFAARQQVERAGQDAAASSDLHGLSDALELGTESELFSTRSAPSSMSQAWLFTGPPGSGRSVAARAFAAALQCTGPVPGCGQCQGCLSTMAGTHPDVEIMATSGVTITVEQTRSMVGRSYVSPSVGSWRIIIVEDADRMAERTTNVLLKAIEEPPGSTVWMLCTPSPDDVMTTIRSRCRNVSLVVPSASDVAELLVRRDGVAPETALVAAKAAQSHIGMARALATNPEVAGQRAKTLREALSIRGAGDAVLAAQRLLANATERAEAQATKNDGRELAELKRSLGVEDDKRIPPAVRAQIRSLEETQKRRATRAKRDVLDRAMVDMLSLFRDVLTVQLGADVELVNEDFGREIRALAEASTAQQSIHRMDSISQARQRLAGNVDPLLTLEAMMLSLRPQASAADTHFA